MLARRVRIYPEQWKENACLRVEIYRCSLAKGENRKGDYIRKMGEREDGEREGGREGGRGREGEGERERGREREREGERRKGIREERKTVH